MMPNEGGRKVGFSRPRQADLRAAAPLAQTQLGYRPQLCAWPGALPVASNSFSADLASD